MSTRTHPVVFADYFCGLGGMSMAAELAGLDAARRKGGGVSLVEIGVAINHHGPALRLHSANHPGTVHWREDLLSFDHGIFGPARGEPGLIDVLLAAPACQGHSQAGRPSRASGGEGVREYHDKLRATAWSVASAARDMAPAAIIVENVPQFLDWNDFGRWFSLIEGYGYRGEVHRLMASDFGVPQLRLRVFVSFVSSGGDVIVEPTTPGARIPASTCIDWDLQEPKWAGKAGMWKPITATRGKKALAMRLDAHKRYPKGVIVSDFGHDAVHCAFTEPWRTITTKSPSQTKIIRSDGMMRRPLPSELARAMGFPPGFKLPTSTLGEADRGLGGAICPPAGQAVIDAVARAQGIKLAKAA